MANPRFLAPELLKQFYRKNNFTQVWADTGGLTTPADSLIGFIRNAKLYGLYPDDYHFRQLTDFLQSPKTNALQIDLYLTDSFFALYHHLKNGRVQRRSLNMTTLRDTLALASLTRALANHTIGSELRKQEPIHPQYHLLKAELKNLVTTAFKDKLVSKRIDQLSVNMERWRWQKKPLPERYVVVNVPAFMLKVVEQDSVLLQSRVIVGKRETQTPELESVIRSFIIYPYWHVPRSILKEILPGIQSDTNYLRKHNYQVLDEQGKVMNASKLDWASLDEKNFPYVLRQREGSENTMGVLKFVFNNNYNVYLHDTNARGLFWRENRAMSHGCVRVHKAVELARYLAKDDDTYVGPEDLDQYLLVQHKLTVEVVKPIPVLLQYFTAESENGKVVYYDDIYGKDSDLLNAMFHFSLHREASGDPSFM